MGQPGETPNRKHQATTEVPMGPSRWDAPAKAFTARVAISTAWKMTCPVSLTEIKTDWRNKIKIKYNKSFDTELWKIPEIKWVNENMIRQIWLKIILLWLHIYDYEYPSQNYDHMLIGNSFQGHVFLMHHLACFNQFNNFPCPILANTCIASKAMYHL